jgi:hypothetical protein
MMPDEEWDEDVIIGGKVNGGLTLAIESARLDPMALRPTIPVLQVFCLLAQSPSLRHARPSILALDQPMAMHSSIGKFLRAVEKALLVNTPWDPPSYTYVPPSQTTGEAVARRGSG